MRILKLKGLLIAFMIGKEEISMTNFKKKTILAKTLFTAMIMGAMTVPTAANAQTFNETNAAASDINCISARIAEEIEPDITTFIQFGKAGNKDSNLTVRDGKRYEVDENSACVKIKVRKDGLYKLEGINEYGEEGIYYYKKSGQKKEKIEVLHKGYLNAKQAIKLEAGKTYYARTDGSPYIYISRLETKNGITYYRRSDKTIGIFAIAAKSKVVIPEKIDGLNVTVIDGWVFQFIDDKGDAAKDKSTVKSIVIPGNVTIIEDNAFCEQKALSDVQFGKNSKLKRIGSAAFEDTGLKRIQLPKKLKIIENWAFSRTKLTNVSIPYGVTDIQCAFSNIPTLKSIRLPESISSIGDNAFDGDKSLKKINIPDRVTKIGNFAFRNTKKLKNVKLGKNIIDINANVGLHNVGDVQDGMIYFDDVFMGPCDKDKSVYKIRFGTKYIASEAFYYYFGKDKDIEDCYMWLISDGEPDKEWGNVVVPHGVVRIGKDAFSCGRRDSVFESIFIPETVNEIEGEYTLRNVSEVRGFAGSYVEKYVKDYNNRIRNKDEKMYPRIRFTPVNCEYHTWNGTEGNYVCEYCGATSKEKTDNGISQKQARKPVIKSIKRNNEGIKIKWSRTKGAEGYQVYRKLGNGKYKLIKNIGGNENTTFTDITITKNTDVSYYIKSVAAYDRVGDRVVKTGSRSKKINFYNLCDVEYTAYSGKYRKNDESPEKIFDMTWKKNKQATGYEVSIVWKEGGKQVRRAVRKTNKTMLSVHFSDNQCFYAKVRAYVKKDGKVYYSGWSEEREYDSK